MVPFVFALRLLYLFCFNEQKGSLQFFGGSRISEFYGEVIQAWMMFTLCELTHNVLLEAPDRRIIKSGFYL